MEKRTDRPSRLSAAFVRDVIEAGRYSDGPGSYGLSLFVRWGARGLTRHYQQRITLNGKRTNIAIGKHPLVTLAEARDIAFANARSVYKGSRLLPVSIEREPEPEPTPAPAPVSDAPTFEALAEQVMADNADAWRGARTMDGWRSRFEQYAYPAIGSLKVDAITTADLLPVLSPVWIAKNATARKLAEGLRRVFDSAIAQGYIASNPADSKVLRAALPRVGKATGHHAALGYVDLADALVAIRDSSTPDGHKLAIEWLALTCVRSGEARGAQWTEIDRETATWTVPASRMKSQREHSVPLSDGALDVLERAARLSDGTGLVFPSTLGTEIHGATLGKPFRNLGLVATIHGMRSSFRDWAAEEGIDHVLAEQCLAHSVGSATERAYRRTSMVNARREVMQQWCVALRLEQAF